MSHWAHIRGTLQDLWQASQETIRHYNSIEAAGSVDSWAATFLEAEAAFSQIGEDDIKRLGDPVAIRLAVNTLYRAVSHTKSLWVRLPREHDGKRHWKELETLTTEERGLLTWAGRQGWKAVPAVDEFSIVMVKNAEAVAWQLARRREPSIPFAGKDSVTLIDANDSGLERKGKDIHGKMEAKLAADPQAADWPVTKWVEYLKSKYRWKTCSVASIHDTKAWRAIMLRRAGLQLDRYGRNKPKKGE